MSEGPARGNSRTLREIHDLFERVLGASVPDRVVAWLGVSKRSAERWLSGDSAVPPSLVDKLALAAALCDDLDDDLLRLVEDYKGAGLSENLLRVRIREFSKRLSEEPPSRPMPLEPKRD